MDHQFSPQTKELISKSREVAIELRAPHISSFHFFLADCLLFEERSARGFVFKNAEDFHTYYLELKSTPETNAASVSSSDALPLTREAEQVLKTSYTEHLQHYHSPVQPLHIMLTALKQPGSQLQSQLHPKEDLYAKMFDYYVGIGLLKEEQTTSFSSRVKDFFSASTPKKEVNKEPVTILRPAMNSIPPAVKNVTETGDKIEMTLVGLQEGQNEKSYVVIFHEKNGPRKVPLVIGLFEAQALSVAIEKMEASRPLTHRLFKQTIIATGYTFKECIIHRLLEGVFHATIALNKNDHTIEQDARPSDAFTLAVLFEAPIYFNSKVLDEVKM